MTKEKAVEILKGAIKKPNTKDGYLGQALDMAIKALEQQTCDDCVSRAEALKHSHIEYDDDGIGHRVVYAEDIEELPSVTPSIPEVEDNFDIGYNCGYADAMCDIGGES